MDFDYDVLFIGAGPGGYVGAIRSRQLGLKTAVVEKDKAGGVCLNVGCIPSKALIEQAARFGSLGELEAMGIKVDTLSFDYAKVQGYSRRAAERLSKGVDFLLKKNGVDYLSGTAYVEAANRVRIRGADGSFRTVSAHSIVVAVGSAPRAVPPFAFDEERILSSSGILAMKTLPKRLAILGAGAIGMEFAYIMSSFGVRVQVVEMMDRILPAEDPEAAQVVRSSFEKRGVAFRTSAKAVGYERTADGSLSIRLAPAGLETSAAASVVPADAGEKTRAEETLEADALLVAVGRSPNASGLGLEELGVRLDRGYVRTGAYYETDVSGIYAVGDIVAGEPQLAHVASAQAEIAAERIAFLLGKGEQPKSRRLDLRYIPSAVYCEPQLASFGLKERDLKASGRPYAAASFPFRGIGKAVAVGRPEGFVKLFADPATQEILGASAVGPEATELIHELLLAARSELVLEDLASTVHAHPTFSEGVKEAVLASLGRAVHA